MARKLLAALSDISAGYGNDTILEFDSFSLYDGDRVGVVGANGAGKSTLLRLIAGEIAPYRGTVKLFTQPVSIPQFGEPPTAQPNGKIAREAAAKRYADHLSGGEKARAALAAAFSAPGALLLADEPTANLDGAGVELVTRYLKSYPGAFLLVSHDRALLDEVCDTIVEVADGGLRVFPGNWSDYEEQKRRTRCEQKTEYEKYVAEKRKLTQAARLREAQGDRMKKAPSRMGNSEARLHKTETRDRRKSVDGQAAALRARLAQLAPVEKVREPRPHILPVPALELKNRFAAEGRGLTVRFGARTVLDGVDFLLETGSRTCLTGDNGAGKTCLLNAVAARDPAVYLPPRVVLSVFRQDLAFADPKSSVLDYAMRDTTQPQSTVRQMLANLQIGKDMLSRPVGVLSGGERVKVLLTAAIAKDANLLLLDEATNYLDAGSRAALEDFLADYPGTVLFVSHDKRFCERLATRVWRLTGGKLYTN